MATQVLGFKDLVEQVHRPVISTLQQFPLPTKDVRAQADRYDKTTGRWFFTPPVDMLKLPGGRRRLILDPRGHFKTTINVVCHVMQWLLNYPDAALFICHAKLETAEDILTEVKNQFLYNDVLRELFPEYGPSAKVKEWGNRQRFTVFCRTKQSRKEPSVMVGSIAAALAGYHFDVMKFTDIVDLQNCRTENSLADVRMTFNMYRNLLVSPSHWIDVEGTRYDFRDLYGTILETWENQHEAHEKDPLKNPVPSYQIHVRGCFKKNTEGKPYKFTPDELDLPILLDDKGLPIPWFPQRFNVTDLLTQRAEDGYVFNSQMLNHPVNGEDEVVFPAKLIKWIPRDKFRENVRIAYYTTTVDTAETVTKRSDFTCITTCGWDKFGRCYVVDVRHGKYLPDQIIDQVFDVWDKWSPYKIRIEETGFVRGLKQSFRRREDLMGVRLPFDFIPRETEISKKQRITDTLQPRFKNGDIRFLQDLPCAERLVQELTRHPRFSDDILDTLADQFQNKNWMGREMAKKSVAEEMEAARSRKEAGDSDPYGFSIWGDETSNNQSYWDMTGNV